MNKLLRYLAAGSAYLAPPLLLVSDILLIQFISEPGLLVQRIALIVFMPAIAVVVVLAKYGARWPVGAGAALAVVGALAIVIRQGVLAGPMRPPAVLFPLGHMSGAPAALIGGDVIFSAAFWSLATQMTRTAPPVLTEAGASGG